MGLDMVVTKNFTVPVIFTPTSLFVGDTGGWYDPSDLTTLWQDGTRLIPVTAAGQPVSAMDDKSGNGNTIAGTAATIRNSGVLWWLEFNGTSSALVKHFTLNQPATDVWALQVRTYNVNDTCFDGTGNSARILERDTSTKIGMFSGSGFLDNTDWTTAANHVVTAVWNSPNCKLAVDNNSYATGDSGSSAPGGITIGAFDISTSFSAMNFYGGIRIGRILTGPEIANCRTYFGAKAGLVL